MRYLIRLEYIGTRYAGWQSQKNAISVQNKLDDTLSIILRQPIETTGSSRTDTSVHALEQFAHFDFPDDLPINIVRQLNGILPNDIAVQHIYAVKDDFHSRFDAVHRSYQYQLVQRKSTFWHQKAYLYPQDLDITLMNEGASILMNNINFKSFCKTKSEAKGYNCKLRYAYWKIAEEEPFRWTFHISSNRFLYGMVRAIVGTLVEIGIKKLSLTQLEEILEAKDRRAASYAAPPYGLFLSEVAYPLELESLKKW